MLTPGWTAGRTIPCPGYLELLPPGRGAALIPLLGRSSVFTGDLVGVVVALLLAYSVFAAMVFARAIRCR
jgi:hypothetical protein